MSSASIDVGDSERPRRIQWQPSRLNLHGRRTDNLVLLYGAVPPAAGPARVAWCLKQGQAQYALAREDFGRVLRAIIPLVPGGLGRLPPVFALHSAHLDIDACRRIGRQRVVAWFSLRQGIEATARRIKEAANIEILEHQWTEAADTARGALDSAATAYHCLREALVEARSMVSHGVDQGDEWRAMVWELSVEVANAHALVHRVGETVGGLFGCTAEHDGDGWMRRCAVDLMHYDFGFSVGYTARHICSVCNDDLALCPHLLGGTYDIEVRRDSAGSCNVCDLQDCDHEVGTTATTVASPRIVDGAIHEVSLTPRPRDPRARLRGVEIPDEIMVAELGSVPSKDAEIWHHHCMYPCDGFFAFAAAGP